MTTGIMHAPGMAIAGDRRRSVTTAIVAPLALRLFTFAILLPSEVSARPGGLFLSPSRIILLVLAPLMVIRLVSQITAGRYRFVMSDLLVTLTGIWIFFALSHTETMAEVFTHGGPMVLELCVTYFAVRVLLTERGQGLALLGDLCLGIAIVGLLGIADSVAGHFVWRDLARSLFGGVKASDAGYRLGLLRAMSTMDHPILFGFVCAVGLVLAASLPIRRRKFAIYSCATGLILALSSAPIQSVIIAFGLFGYERLLKGVGLRWTVLLSVVVAVVLAVFQLVDNPLGYIFNHLVFDTESAYYRIYIWQQAGAVISEKPWFGIGYVCSADYDIPSTVDSVWLVWSLTFGVPGALLLAASLIGTASLPTRGRGVRLSDVETKIGLTLGILIVTIMFLGFTVHFFGEEWMVIPLLMGVRAHLGELGRSGERAVTASVPRRMVQPRGAQNAVAGAPLRGIRLAGIR